MPIVGNSSGWVSVAQGATLKLASKPAELLPSEVTPSGYNMKPLAFGNVIYWNTSNVALLSYDSDSEEMAVSTYSIPPLYEGNNIQNITVDGGSYNAYCASGKIICVRYGANWSNSTSVFYHLDESTLVKIHEEPPGFSGSFTSNISGDVLMLWRDKNLKCLVNSGGAWVETPPITADSYISKVFISDDKLAVIIDTLVTKELNILSSDMSTWDRTLLSTELTATLTGQVLNVKGGLLTAPNSSQQNGTIKTGKVIYIPLSKEGAGTPKEYKLYDITDWEAISGHYLQEVSISADYGIQMVITHTDAYNFNFYLNKTGVGSDEKWEKGINSCQTFNTADFITPTIDGKYIHVIDHKNYSGESFTSALLEVVK